MEAHFDVCGHLLKHQEMLNFSVEGMFIFVVSGLFVADTY